MATSSGVSPARGWALCSWNGGALANIYPWSEHRLVLRPPLSTDLPVLYEWAIDPVSGYRWRYHGHVPSYDEFVSSMQSDVLMHLVGEALDDESHRPTSQATAYGADFVNSLCFLAVQVAPGADRGTGVETGLRFLERLFDAWSFRKVYMEVPEYNMDVLSRVFSRPGFADAVVLEGSLKEYCWWKDRYWAKLYFSVSRQAFGTHLADQLG